MVGSMHSAASDPGEPRLDGVVVLLVEDHADSREFLRQLLEAIGAEVLAAPDALAGWGILEARIPDVVLSDLRMPGMDGLEFAHRIKHDVRFARIPLVAVTAYNSHADLRATLESGFAGHVEKPIDWAVLVGTVKRVMEQAAREPHAAQVGRARRRRARGPAAAPKSPRPDPRPRPKPGSR
jgi:CheY-like chemotaxis protein